MTDSERAVDDELESPSARRMRLVEKYGVFAVVVLMIVVLTILEPEIFPTTQNLTNILRQIAMNATRLISTSQPTAIIHKYGTKALLARSQDPRKFAASLSLIWFLATTFSPTNMITNNCLPRLRAPARLGAGYVMVRRSSPCG